LRSVIERARADGILASQRRSSARRKLLGSSSSGSAARPFKVSGTATEYARVGDQGSKYTFSFCPLCGSTVFHVEEGNTKYVSVAVGAFADPSFPPPEDSVYDCRRHPWVQVPANVVAYDKDPP
jgi:hypothetical protein